MDLNNDIGEEVKRTHKEAVSRRPKATAPSSARPARPKWLEKGITSFSDNIRKNVADVLSVEVEVNGEDGLNKSELGRLMGLRSAVIYSILNGRNEIGSAILIRMSHALGLAPHRLTMPHNEFVEHVIPAYRESSKSVAAERKRTKRTAKKAS